MKLNAKMSAVLVPALCIFGCGKGSSVAASSAALPAVTLSSANLAFGSQTVNTSGVPQTLTLTNSGQANLVVGGIAISGTDATSFSETSTCGALAAGVSCSIAVTFSPKTVGPYSASLVITDNAGGSPRSVPLVGTGAAVPAPVLGLSTAAVSFSQLAETVGTVQTITVSNTGNAPLIVSGVKLGGANPISFVAASGCGTVASGSSCAISLTFQPMLAMTHSATLTISSNAGSDQVVSLKGTATGALSINTSNPVDWVISNGAITLDWNSTTGTVWRAQLIGSSDQLVDTTQVSKTGQPTGLNMVDVGLNLGSGTSTATYVQNGNEYLDWSITTVSNATNAFTTTQHFILTANDTGFHVYSTVGHSATDIAGNIGQWQYVFRDDLNLFQEMYSVDTSLGNLGVSDILLPAPSYYESTDVGRQVQNAAVDLHGLPTPSSFTRQFYTKYDYQSTEYLHHEHGMFGTKYGLWALYPRTETLIGGPTKQDLIFEGNMVAIEALSGHLSNTPVYTPLQGVASNRLFGPFYYHFNTFTATNTTPASLYQETATWLPQFGYLYDGMPLCFRAGIPLHRLGDRSLPLFKAGDPPPRTRHGLCCRTMQPISRTVRLGWSIGPPIIWPARPL